MDPKLKLLPDRGTLEDQKRYMRLVGKLNYLTMTGQNSAYPVSVVSQFMLAPQTSYWDVVVRIL